MDTIGAFEAKTHLSALLDRVANGEEFIITKHGKPVGRLTGAVKPGSDRAKQAVDRLKELSKPTTLDGVSWKELCDTGRR